ncbi:TPA: hypothetical protein NKP43_000751 [Vibrio parahaemolyticus]|nr:hypothetical protein [Vibrio parahaemolyticus]HCE1978159.1 hypothetical protein [Vibrio parahaemolyticus]HCE3378267.1 hypothetical protein [Vibrio parahaemolyticus]HCG6656879.1 hypothetical protein [Vibrio parahaemolyticus]HCH0941208.1 hypothetical protein [Vibrio parahaemolyticus]
MKRNKIEILSGNIADNALQEKEWRLDGENISIGSYRRKYIPIKEFISIETTLQSNGQTFFSVILSQEKWFKAVASDVTFVDLVKEYNKIGNKPSEIKFPYEVASYKNIKDRIAQVAAIVFFIIFMIIGSIDNASHKNNKPIELSKEFKIEICKSYIGTLFGRSPSIMNNYKNTSDGLIYIKYTRDSDGSEWSNVCEFDDKNATVIWAAYDKYSQKWGRWRYEDETKLYKHGSFKVTYKIPTGGSGVVYLN